MFRKIRRLFQDDLCSDCASKMEMTRKQLYAMPTQWGGHYGPHTDAVFYKRNLTLVKKKADIPVGMYACGLIAYRCPQCGHRTVKASIFLPVRGEEKMEQTLYFDQGELRIWPD